MTAEYAPDLQGQTQYLVIDQLNKGWSTRSYPHRLLDGQLAVLDNLTRVRDNIWTIRAGNRYYGGSAAGATGSTTSSLSGTRFYYGNPVAGQLVVHSGAHLYTGNDSTGAFTQVASAMSTTHFASFAQMYDPDNAKGAAVSLFITDGSRIPQIWDGTNFIAVTKGGNFLPNGVVSGVAITPLYCCTWGPFLVYANEPTDPTALWISDALRPERFTGTALIDSAGTTYVPYYPGGRNGDLGVITGVCAVNGSLVVIFSNGVVVGKNTGSYGAFQFVWETLSRKIGTTSPQSIISLDNHVAFFGGHSFYATDGQDIKRITPELPTLYIENNQADQPPEINNTSTVSGWRFHNQLIWSYNSQQGGTTYRDRAVCFDMDGDGGWQFALETGGVWNRVLAMPMAWGVHCGGPGDTHQTFWGSDNADAIYEWNPGSPNATFTDPASTAIAFEIRTKAFFLDRPIHPKMVKGIYPIMVFTAASTSFDVTVNPYAIFDGGAPVNYTPITVTVAPLGTPYGQKYYGAFDYEASNLISQQSAKSTPNGGPTAFPVGKSIQVGITGSSSQSFSIIGFVIEVSTNDVEF